MFSVCACVCFLPGAILHIVTVAIILVSGQLSVVSRSDCSYYCTVLERFHYFILYAALYCYITLTCGLTGHLCSEISCNVKLNVYLAMEIPDCVSFVSG